MPLIVNEILSGTAAAPAIVIVTTRPLLETVLAALIPTGLDNVFDAT